ncbi:hypothetical protein BDR06DRAFT_898584 [Suillus hirtellus]|nr:hypothetical protein BDR06DRAFT_898584 [Suillus hirtellus]
MHFSGANMAALFTDLWRGLMLCSPTDDALTWDWAVLVDDTWEAHGQAVAACQPYLPGSFDNPPRNPAEKINTHYKAHEFIMWLFGLALALLYNVLPRKYWQNFCKFTQALQIMSQYSITPSQVTEAFTLFAEWEIEFKNLYYQHRADHIHFIRPCAHLSNHIAAECLHVGSPICSSQWTMERTFADIEFDLRQPKLPYACLTQVCLVRCQINAVKAMFPHLQPPSNLHPRYSFDVGDGYVLLRAREKRPKYPETHTKERLISVFLGRNAPKMYQWSRLRLPNGQVARSTWKEALQPLEKTRMSRNVKVLHTWRFRTVALVSLYSAPDRQLLKLSHQTVWSCTDQGEAGLCVVDVTNIQAVVAVIPHRPTLPSGVTEDRLFVVEKTGLDVSYTGVFAEEDDNDGEREE